MTKTSGSISHPGISSVSWVNGQIRTTGVVKAHPDWIGKGHEPSRLWIKLADFEGLDPPLKLSNFRKGDGSLIRNGWEVRGGLHPVPLNRATAFRSKIRAAS